MQDLVSIIKLVLGPSELVKRLRDPSTSDQERIEIVRELKRRWERKEVSAEELIEEGFVIRTKSSKWVEPQRALLPSEYEPYTNVERLVKAGLLECEHKLWLLELHGEPGARRARFNREHYATRMLTGGAQA